MKAVTYWESAPGKTMPPYIALCIATMRLALGSSFLLLHENNISEFLQGDFQEKSWAFKPREKEQDPEIKAIVAKSDYIRMAYVAQNGGFWMDADTIVFKNFLQTFELTNNAIYWHSEQFFGGNSGSRLLKTACAKALADEYQSWGNPGDIKNLIQANPEEAKTIPPELIDPGYRPTYTYANWEILLDKEINVQDFLNNKEAKLMKLYNTYLRESGLGLLSMEEFFDSNTLISRIFLSLNPDKKFWITQTDRILRDHNAS
ncbi:capsular polysaccharide synthesis protein [Pseudomonas juntendi]|nr:capsular polysaccharide synthesis protein [Pseudomonas juntendi]